jgi:hypothetical protein
MSEAAWAILIGIGVVAYAAAMIFVVRELRRCDSCGCKLTPSNHRRGGATCLRCRAARIIIIHGGMNHAGGDHR